MMNADVLIYFASDPNIKIVPNWVASNTEALKEMKALAEA